MHKIIIEIPLLIIEKSWNNHGILILNFCGNPVLISALKQRLWVLFEVVQVSIHIISMF